MRRLEIIHLRLAGDRPPGLADDIRRSIAAEVDLESVWVYHHATVPSDLGVHLHLQVDDPEGRPSDLGVRLAASLRELGMVEHTVWLEEQTAETKVRSR